MNADKGVVFNLRSSAFLCGRNSLTRSQQSGISHRQCGADGRWLRCSTATGGGLRAPCIRGPLSAPRSAVARKAKRAFAQATSAPTRAVLPRICASRRCRLRASIGRRRGRGNCRRGRGRRWAWLPGRGAHTDAEEVASEAGAGARRRHRGPARPRRGQREGSPVCSAAAAGRSSQGWSEGIGQSGVRGVAGTGVPLGGILWAWS